MKIPKFEILLLLTLSLTGCGDKDPDGPEEKNPGVPAPPNGQTDSGSPSVSSLPTEKLIPPTPPDEPLQGISEKAGTQDHVAEELVAKEAVVGPLEIPRAEMSTKYGWNGAILCVPIGSEYSVRLIGRGRSADLTFFGGSGEIPQLTSDEGYMIAGKNIKIGNLYFEGSFTWTDEMITLLDGTSMHE